ncbi:hypothetical protein ACWDRB_47205 [Nonomuraea sp. NPDC003707]
MLTRPQLEALAGDLHIALATGEYTRDGAIRLLSCLGGTGEAAAILDEADPIRHGTTYVELPCGDRRPIEGTARLIWEYLYGSLQGREVIPYLIDLYGSGWEGSIRSFAC